MKKLITHNLPLKIMSVAFAFILWLVVVNINDPDSVRTIRSIEITILNEEAITGQGQGQVYTIKENKTASITVKGPRSIVDKMTRNDVKAVVDFSEVSSVGAVPISIISLPEGVTLQNKNTESMKIIVEPILSQRFKVEIETTGTPADGYVVGETEVSPNVVNIKAPESVMEQIKRVLIQVDVDGMSTDVSGKSVPLILIDGNGKVIDYAENEHISISAVMLLAEADILRYQSVPVQAAVSGEVADGYRYTGIELSHSSVALKGTRDVMSQISAVSIPAGVEEALDLNGLTENKSSVLDLLPYLPEGTELLDEQQQYVTVTLKVEELKRKTVHISTDVLNVSNVPDNMEISYEMTPDATVEFEGLQADLDLVNAADLKPSIDLGGRGAGVHVCPVEIELPDKLTVIRPAYLTVILSEPHIPEETREETGEEESRVEAETESGSHGYADGRETSAYPPETEPQTIPVIVKPVEDEEMTERDTEPQETQEETTEQETAGGEEEVTEPPAA